LPSEPLTGEPALGTYAEDLALARACEAGDHAAWERFVREYQPILQRAAQAIDPSGGARDTADALFGELYQRKLFRYFHGRSKLSTWLRAVLAQRHVDQLRERRRTTSLPDAEGEWPAARQGDHNGEHGRFVEAVRHALAEAINALDARDRLRLKCYYADGMKLAAIGRMLREHEATASRNLERTRQQLRTAAEQQLKSIDGFDAAAYAECIDAVLRDPGAIDIDELMPSAGPARNRPRIVQTNRSGL
jgi:RNA polymerase sigma factor (sigma-70 family)